MFTFIMLSKPIIAHGFWATPMVVAFFVATARWKSTIADHQKPKTQDQATGGQSNLHAPSETETTKMTLT